MEYINEREDMKSEIIIKKEPDECKEMGIDFKDEITIKRESIEIKEMEVGEEEPFVISGLYGKGDVGHPSVDIFTCFSPFQEKGNDQYPLGIVVEYDEPTTSETPKYTTPESELNQENPWPYISQFFTFISRTSDSTVKFACELCRPSVKCYSANKKSLYNLRKHIEVKHGQSKTLFETTIKLGSKEQTSLKRSISSKKHSVKKLQLNQSFISESLLHGNKVTQNIINELITDLIIEEMLPFKLVEAPSFKKLIAYLQPTKKGMCRRTLCTTLSNKYEQCKLAIKKNLLRADCVATTADCWSCHNRSYIGVTVHWIDHETLLRRHAVLACRRVRGTHSYDLIAKELEVINVEFCIQNKTVKITTDKGSNFVKAFRFFDPTTSDCGESSTDAVATETQNELDDELSEKSQEIDEDDNYAGLDEVSFHGITQLLSEKINSSSTHLLPEHHRCAAHTLNLVATTDAEKALSEPMFRKISRSAIAKAQELWSKQNQNTVAADMIQKEFLQKLVVPNATQWNSTFNAICHLNSILAGKESSFHRICNELSVGKFNPMDILFFKEYAAVMKPIAQTLDVLQGEQDAYMGILLPSLTVCLKKLNKIVMDPLRICLPLAKALIAGVMKRFQSVMEDDDTIMAAAFHPRFKLCWLDNESKFVNIKNKMLSKLESHVLHHETSSPDRSNLAMDDIDDEDFFDCLVGRREVMESKMKLNEQLNIFLHSAPSRKVINSCFPGLEFKKAFIASNTPIPSSAAVEKVFSVGKDILRPKRSSLTDTNFEKLIFLKMNKDFLNT